MDRCTTVEGGVELWFVGERDMLFGADVVVGNDSSIVENCGSS